jgi:glycoside/pentoside/hexuronide:cation symporter, GPH family
VNRMRRPWTIFVFSLAILPVGMLNIAVPIYLPPYFAHDLGMGLAVTGTLFAVVRLLSICIDPLLGVLMDRTRTSFGRYKVWMAAAAPVLMLATFVSFLADKNTTPVFLAAWLLLLYGANSAILVSQSAWGATLASQYDERSRVFGVIIGMSVVGAVLALVPPFLSRQPSLANAQAVPLMGWLIIFTCPLAIGLTAWLTPERISQDTARRSLADYLIILRKREVVRLLLGYFALTLGPGWTSAMYIFYCRDVLGYDEAQTALGLLLYVVAGALGSPTASRLAVRFGKHQAMMMSAAVYALALCTLFFIGRGDVWAGYVLMTVCGFTAFGFGVLANAIMADVGDEIRLASGTERSGLLYALMTLANKLSYAVSIAITFPLLQEAGYNPAQGVFNTPAAIHSMQLIYVVVPILSVIAGGTFFIGWRLDAARHAEVRSQIERRDADFLPAAKRRIDAR